jgi:hypothetical protein
MSWTLMSALHGRKRAWRAFKAMDAYMTAKSVDNFTGNLRDYCEQGGPSVVPATWIAVSESESTDNNDKFRALRTLPIDPAVCGESTVYMPAHIKIEQGRLSGASYPLPRRHWRSHGQGPRGLLRRTSR